MLLTECGIDQIELWRNRIASRFSEIVLGHPADCPEPKPENWEGECDLQPDLVHPQPELLRFRTQLRAQPAEPELSGYEQRARVLALRGLSQARDGEYERARMTFASAARLDPRLDLALLPAFWSLPRRAHEVAVAALNDAHRGRDAVALTATIRTRFRPRALRAINCRDDSTDDRSRNG